MELLLLIVAIVVAFEFAALRWGHDSRDLRDTFRGIDHLQR